MFPRMKSNGKYGYLQIVENHRVDGKTRQQVVASLGRLDKSGQLDNLTRGLGRFCKKLYAMTFYAPQTPPYPQHCINRFTHSQISAS